MAIILNIDSTTKTCSVALCRDGKLLNLQESHDDGYVHAEKLNVYIKKAFAETGLDYTQLDAVSVAEGPGSYTGLRIGVSSAKGLCYALEIPLIAVNPLLALALQVKRTLPLVDDVAICPMIDARRDEVFTAVYDTELKLLQPTTAIVITPAHFDKWNYREIYLCGDGAPKFKNWFAGMFHIKVLEVLPSALYNGIIADGMYNKKQFADLAYFEPYYGKEFQVTSGKK